MTRYLSKLTLNQKLGLLALVLGALAVFAEVAPARTVTVHEKDLAMPKLEAGGPGAAPGAAAPARKKKEGC